MFKPLYICFLLFAASFLVLHSCKKDDEIIDINELEFDLLSNVDIDRLIWYDELHAMRARYDLISFTSDGGRTWSTEWEIPSDVDIESMAYPQVDTAYVFAQDVSDVDIYRTTDRGTTWSLVYVVQTGANCSASAWARSAKKVFCLTENTSNVYKVYKTTNAGVNWGAGPTVPQLWNFFAATDSIYFAISPDQDLWKTTDIGWDFAITTPGNNVLDYVILPTLQKGFFIDESGVIYRSDDYGDTWHIVLNDPAGSGADIIEAHESGLVVAAGRGAPLISKDFGETWHYYTFKGGDNEIEYAFQHLYIVNSTTVICYFYDREAYEDKLVKCYIP